MKLQNSQKDSLTNSGNSLESNRMGGLNGATRGSANNQAVKKSSMYDEFVSWLFSELFKTSGTLGRVEFTVIMLVIHFAALGLSVVLPFLAPFLFIGGAYLLIINGYKRVRDINNGENVPGEWKFIIFVCAFIPVVWQLLALILIFSPRKDQL